MSKTKELRQVERQEEALILPELDFDVAHRLGAILRELSVERSLSVAIEVRVGEALAYYVALPGSSPDNADWIRRKRNVVFRCHASSYQVGLVFREKGEDFHEKTGASRVDFATHGGAFPLRLSKGGPVLGVVAVSGLPQKVDHELVVEALCALLERDYEELKLR